MTETGTNIVKISELATPERTKQDGGVVIEAIDRNLQDNDVIQVRQRAKVADKMDWYLQRRTIDEGMAASGKHLMVLFFRAGKVPKTSIMFREFTDRTQGGDHSSIAQIDAHNRLDAALDMLSQAEIDVLREVCCYDKYAQANRIGVMCRGLAVLSEAWGF